MNAHVLIVDDDSALLHALPETVRARVSNVIVEIAETAHAALSRIAATDYDAIISDVKMPGMDGLALLREIRSLRPDTPTLLVTGHGEHDLALQALRGGAYDFIQKPIDRDYFVASLNRAIQVRRLKRQVDERTIELTKVNADLTQEVRERKLAQEALHASHEELRTLAGKLLKVQEEERRRISSELHDDLNQKLAVLVMNVEAIERRMPPPDTLREHLRMLRNEIMQMSDDVRQMAYRLHPSILDHLGLAVALQSHVEDLAKREHMTAIFRHRNLPDSLPHDISTCLYRVAQESLRNVVKHAGASHVAVRLSRWERFLYLSIFDAGVGFDAKSNQTPQGLGLVSMHERVRLVQGRLSVRSRRGRGTYVLARVPLPDNLSSHCRDPHVTA